MGMLINPHLLPGYLSLPGLDERPVRILRDTGAAQPFVLEGVAPLSKATAAGTYVLVRSFEMRYVEVPLHQMQLSSDLVTGTVVVGVRSFLPVPGVEFILGNDLVGGSVWGNSVVTPLPVDVSQPCDPVGPDECFRKFPNIFLACATTRA